MRRVTERPANFGNEDGEASVGYETVGPQRLMQVGFGDSRRARPQQHGEQLEGFRREVQLPSGAPQLTCRIVEGERPECGHHTATASTATSLFYIRQIR